ncbi:MAG: T9SS type A sorting domain-containing protein, partial [Flavobacteriales bacterium]|nr:T9SS type A sorting domain-containing protein [Flavobacteriales bacterium]
DLTIDLGDTTIVYNDPIPSLPVDYIFNGGDASGINLSTVDSIALVNAIKSVRGTALVNAPGLVRGTALVNAEGDQLLTEALLNSFSFLVSQTVVTTRGTALVNGELIDPAELYEAGLANAVSGTSTEARLVRGTALVNGYGLVRGTALVNTIDSLGNITNTSSLTNSGSLVNSSGTLNSNTITLNSNTQTLVILGEEDIAILSGETPGNVVIRSVNLITGNTVGTHLSIPGTFLTSNYNVTYGLGQITIIPDTAEISIAPGTLAQTYTGSPLAVGVTIEPAGTAYTVTYNGSTTPPTNAGSYAVHVAVDDPNIVGSADATLVIAPAPAQITIAPASLTQTYTGTARTVGVTVAPSGLAYSVTYNGSSTAPVNAGSYPVQITVNDPNYTGSATATLNVQKALATATVGTYVINKGASLPTFTATYSGFVNGETASVVGSVTFTLSPNYNGNAGIYQIIVNATAANYVFNSVNGTLYVNPAGPGTKQVKPTFICYMALNAPDANGHTHIAYFQYENRNSTAVYIPVGPNNEITGPPHDASEQPMLFLPGGGAIAVPFNNTGQLTWQISSNKNNGTTGSIPANSSNVVCSSPGQKNLALRDEEDVTILEPRVYPNPSSGSVFIEFPEEASEVMAIEVYDRLGVLVAMNTTRTGDHRVQLDFTSLAKGLYIIRIINTDGQVHRNVIIE